ncbi:MAG: hypothetical protein E7632_12065 [Ruminococcaceae bacterium]|nr:hypothetical protein [Oscillospiraceae bacterium]
MKFFKWLLPLITAASLAVGVSAASVENTEYKLTHAYTLRIENKTLETEKLPFSAYQVGGDDVTDVMIPLRAVCEALGYIVGWNPDNGEITVDDGVQIMIVTDGCMEAKFIGKMGLTSLDRVMPLAFPVIIHDGHTYVPLSLFSCMLTESKVMSGEIQIKRMK